MDARSGLFAHSCLQRKAISLPDFMTWRLRVIWVLASYFGAMALMLVPADTARATETVTIDCAHDLEAFLRGEIYVPPGAQVTVVGRTLSDFINKTPNGAEIVNRLLQTPQGRAAIASGGLITDSQLRSCQERVRNEMMRRRDQDRPSGAAVSPFTPGKPIYVYALVYGRNGHALARLLLDTGADSTMIKSVLLNVVDGAFAGHATVRGVTGDEARVEVYTITSLEVDNAKVGPMRVLAYTAASDEIDGLLGRDFLDRFTVIIDSTAGRVTLSPKQ
jgi:Aspartyl protease